VLAGDWPHVSGYTLPVRVMGVDAGGKRRGLRVWSVGTLVAKGELYRWLKLEWPTGEALDEAASYPPCTAPMSRMIPSRHHRA
jgi:phage terminase large subunit GpA-like protein